MTPAEPALDEPRPGRERRPNASVHAETQVERNRRSPENSVGSDAVGMSPATMDSLELELRQLEGVGYVSFSERSAGTVICLAVHPGANPTGVQVEAHRVAVRHLDGPIEVEIVGNEPAAPDRRSGMRVRLLMSRRSSDDDRVELHLAQGDRRAMVDAVASDSVAVASQVVQALRELGYPTPFVVESVHDLSPELGSGSLVVLRHPLSGQRRRGLANGGTRAEAHARAVLSALNRYLQPSGDEG